MVWPFSKSDDSEVRDKTVELLDEIIKQATPVIATTPAPVAPVIYAPGVLLEAENPVKQIKSTSMKLTMTQSDLDAEIKRLEKTKSALLPIENSKVQEEEMDGAIHRLLQMKLDLLFPRLDPAFLTWRRKDGWPSLAIFSLDAPLCEFFWKDWNADDSHASKEELNLAWAGRRWPENFRKKYYSDVFDRLEILARNKYPDDHRGCARIAAQFSGLLPEKTKGKLEGLRNLFGSRMFVVREAPEWKLNTWVAPRKWDPLLVGTDYDGLWLLDEFDLTPLERIIKSEWATGPKA
jgi:hypothetical protein